MDKLRDIGKVRCVDCGMFAISNYPREFREIGTYSRDSIRNKLSLTVLHDQSQPAIDAGLEPGLGVTCYRSRLDTREMNRRKQYYAEHVQWSDLTEANTPRRCNAFTEYVPNLLPKETWEKATAHKRYWVILMVGVVTLAFAAANFICGVFG